MKTKRTGALLLLLTLAGMLGVGCPFSPGKTKPDPPPPKYLPQSSADNVLSNLMTAYNERNFDEYMKLFSTDFTFEFCPKDARRPDNPTPATWGLPEEQTSTYKLFTDDTVNKIELNFLPQPAVQSNDEYPGTWKVLQNRITLRVYTTNEEGGTLIWLVDQADDWFYFREYPEEKATDGNNLWRICRWKDQPEQAAMAAALSSAR